MSMSGADLSTRFTSIFSLRETGGSYNYPAKMIDNPQGGFKVMPFFGDLLKKIREPIRSKSESQEKGGAFNFPARSVDNPEGGFTDIPIFGNYFNLLPKGQRQSKHKEKAGNWGLGGPSVVKPNPQGGILMFPLFGPGFKQISEKGAKGGAKKPEKPKEPKPLRPRKGKPVHKKLHANPHPILAECGMLLGQGLGKKECDSSSMTPLVTVPGQTRKRESNFNIVTSRFREAAGQGMPNKFRVVLIEEGMGNSTDAYYYSRDALESAVQVFNGLKIYADHPTNQEESDRPERSTRDVLGHYENLKVELSADGQAQLCADVDILPCRDTEWARACMLRAVENAKKFPDRDFIGLSINASGPSEERPIDDVISLAPQGARQKLLDAQAEGIETVKLVSQINRAVSCDLVTEAGAGGKILNVIGGADGQKTA